MTGVFYSKYTQEQIEAILDRFSAKTPDDLYSYEDLLAFAKWVASEVVQNEDEWEDNLHYAFPEIACRKLCKLGIVSIMDTGNGTVYIQTPQKEEGDAEE